MRALPLALLASSVLLTNLQGADTNRLDQAATSKAIEKATAARNIFTFEQEMEKWPDAVESIRWRYKEFLELQERGHKDYQEAIRVYIEACKRAIEHHYQLKKYRPEFQGAEAAAASYYREEKRLTDEAKKAWAEALQKKKVADSKWQPAPPPPKPKSKDPYLEEQP